MKTFLQKSFILFLLTLTISTLSFSQVKKTFENVLGVDLGKMRPIYEGDIIKGYYMFYDLDRVDKENKAFMIQILDENLRVVASPTLTRSKSYLLSEVIFNGKVILFTFIDPKKKIVELLTLDRTGQVFGKKIIEDVEKWDYRYYSFIKTFKSNKSIKKSGGSIAAWHDLANAMGASFGLGLNTIYGNIIPATEDGFAIIKYLKDGLRVSVLMEFLPNDLKASKTWKNRKLTTFYGVMDISGDYVVLAEPPLPSKNQIHIKVMNLRTGNTVMEKRISNKKYDLGLLRCFYEEESNEVVLIARYYDDASNPLLTNKSHHSLGLGLYGARYNMEGEAIQKKFTSWEGKIEKHIRVDKKGRMTDTHKKLGINRVMAVNGKYYLIGEIKGVYKIMTVDAQTTSGSDFYIFELNSDFSLEEIYSWDWASSKVRYTEGKASQAQITRDKSIKAFDYLFTQESKNKDFFSTAYLALNKENGGKQKPILWVISGSEDGFYEDRINLETDASDIYVYKAKPGYYLIVEYFKNEKKLDLRLEKFNY